MSPGKLISAQSSDPTLAPLFESIRTMQMNVDAPQVYSLKDAILMRKWAPSNSSQVWNTVNQIVVPLVYRDMILNVAHDGSASHLGVANTYN